VKERGRVNMTEVKEREFLFSRMHPCVPEDGSVMVRVDTVSPSDENNDLSLYQIFNRECY
jgi:hypothetical protein